MIFFSVEIKEQKMIEFRNVSKTYTAGKENVEAVHNANFTIWLVLGVCAIWHEIYKNYIFRIRTQNARI